MHHENIQMSLRITLQGSLFKSVKLVKALRQAALLMKSHVMLRSMKMCLICLRLGVRMRYHVCF